MRSITQKLFHYETLKNHSCITSLENYANRFSDFPFEQSRSLLVILTQIRPNGSAFKAVKSNFASKITQA